MSHQQADILTDSGPLLKSTLYGRLTPDFRRTINDVQTYTPDMRWKNLLLLSFLGLSLVAQTTCAQTRTSETAAARNQSGTDWTTERKGVPKGDIESFTIDDKQYNRKRKVWVYTPPGYSAKTGEPYHLLISFDGDSYQKDIPAPTILDNLLAAGKIYPTVQIMVDNSEDRLGDLANRQQFADFLSKDLLAWAQKNFRVTNEASKTTLCGYSAGGLAAAFVALKYPHQFGNVLAQSGAFWRGNEGSTQPIEWLTAQLKAAPKLNLRFYLEVGAGETVKTVGGISILEANRHLRDVLQAKGYDIKYLEVPNAVHNSEHWRSQLADGIVHLIGRQ
jgi:enterochelin esterase-like enzyme